MAKADQSSAESDPHPYTLMEALTLPLVRVRQHVNPLNRKYQQPTILPDWASLYADPLKPLHLDIGCARGQFVLDMAQQRPDWNFLGLEIREPLVIQANQQRDEWGLTNLHYLFCNANIMLGPLLQSFPAGTVRYVSIQFPDPWFKKRHQKRRVVQPDMVDQMAQHLPSGATIFLQSDIKAVAEEMCDRVTAHPLLVRQGDDWLPDNPLPVATEREALTLSQGEPVYRALFKRL